jgi:hypothetical protein
VYIRTREDALDAVAAVLDLPDRAAQIVQSTVKIMLCLDAEPRRFLADCQALLIEDGLEALSRKRQDLLDSMEQLPLIVLDPEGDRLFQAAAGGLDALELTQVIREVFPELRAERWLVARALLRAETELRDSVSTAIRSRGRQEDRLRARREIEAAVAAARPAWIDRAGSLRAACLDVVKDAGLADVDSRHEEANLLFELFAVSDERAQALLDARDEDAIRQVARLHEALEAVRGLRADGAGPASQAA